jgi:hypothetical protein
MVPNQCFADWTKTIECPAGRIYRDVRHAAGREEFCELLLPGSLKVQDGPSRWWYSEGHFGEEGRYQNGRKVERWKECDRFDRCHDRTYELMHSEEQARGVKPEIPVSYSNGKYKFDFGSCWSTWVTRQTSESFVKLNIGAGLIRCQVTYIPAIPAVEKDRPAGSQRPYLCEIPYSVGTRELDSLDLRNELVKIGLPQFCRQDEPPTTANMPNGPAAQAFAILVNQRSVDGRTNKETRGWTTLANLVDVECAAINPQALGTERLTVRLNEYAEQLVLDRVGKDEIKADACGGRLPLSLIDTTRDTSGRQIFVYGLSSNRATAERQRRCIATQIALQPTCASR